MAATNIGPCVIKAQVSVGKRGKAGGIKLRPHTRRSTQGCRNDSGMSIGDYYVNACLSRSRPDIAREFYAAVLHDLVARRPTDLCSPPRAALMSKKSPRRSPPPSDACCSILMAKPNTADFAGVAQRTRSWPGGSTDRANSESVSMRRTAHATPNWSRSIRWRCLAMVAWSRSIASLYSTTRQSTGNRNLRQGRCRRVDDGP